MSATPLVRYPKPCLGCGKWIFFNNALGSTEIVTYVRTPLGWLHPGCTTPAPAMAKSLLQQLSLDKQVKSILPHELPSNYGGLPAGGVMSALFKPPSVASGPLTTSQSAPVTSSNNTIHYHNLKSTGMTFAHMLNIQGTTLEQLASTGLSWSEVQAYLSAAESGVAFQRLKQLGLTLALIKKMAKVNSVSQFGEMIANRTIQLKREEWFALGLSPMNWRTETGLSFESFLALT